jgi:hypothetical protein
LETEQLQRSTIDLPASHSWPLGGDPEAHLTWVMQRKGRMTGCMCSGFSTGVQGYGCRVQRYVWVRHWDVPLYNRAIVTGTDWD